MALFARAKLDHVKAEGIAAQMEVMSADDQTVQQMATL